MSNVRIYALSSTATTPNFDDYFVLDGVTCGTRNILATTALTATTGFGPLNIAGNLTVTGTISTASTIYANNFYTASSFPVTLSGVCVISNNICATGNICGAVLYSGGAQVCTSTTTAGSGAFASPTTAGTLFGSTTYSNLSSNTFLGLSAGNANSTGCYNTYIGTNAGNGVTTGCNNTFIGNNVGSNCAATTCCTTIIGAGNTCLCLSCGTLSLSQPTSAGCPISLNIAGFYPTYACLPGNNIVPTVGYYTTYTSASTYNLTVPVNAGGVCVMLIGGGGGGGGSGGIVGNWGGGGGGAGGVVITGVCTTGNTLLGAGGSYTIVVGAAGSGGAGGCTGLNGCPTCVCGTGLNTYIACGGGAGAGGGPSGGGVVSGCPGGSGGGAGGTYAGAPAGCSNQTSYPGTTIYGNAGGTTGNGQGGGGGAGAIGCDGGYNPGGNGGIGIYNSYTNGALIGQNVSGNYYVAGGGCGGGYSTGGGSFGCGGGSSYAGGGGGGHAGGSNLAGSNGGVGAAIVATLSAATSSTICIGSTYVTQDTCIIWYWNGSQYVNRGTYNSSYNQTNCSMYTGYGALSSSINTVGFTNLSANTGVGNIGIGGYAGGNITCGNFNTILGFNAGRCLTTGVNNTIIGAGADLGSNLSNTILLSAGTQNLYVSSGCLFVNSNIYSSGTASTSSFNVLSAVNLSAFNGFINTLSAFNLSATNVYSNSAAFNNLSAGSIISTNLKSTSAFLNFLNVAYTSNTPTNYGALNVGSGYGYSAPGQIATFAGNDNVETYLAVQNTNSSASAYAAFTLTNDSNYANYVELAINSTNYNYASAGFPNSTFDAPSAASLYNYGGDLVIGTYSNKGLHFITNAGVATTDSLLISATNQGNVVSTTGLICGGTLYSGGLQVCTSTTVAGSGAFAQPTAAGTLFGSTTYSNLSSNTFLGISAGNANSTGCYNTFIGTNAGNGLTTGNYNTFIGNNVGSNCAATTCCTTIIGNAGGNCLVLQSGSVTLNGSCPVTLNITGFVPNCNCLTNLTSTSAVSFTSTGTSTWTVPTGITTVCALLVAGGGGGKAAGAGGGAGGVVYNTNVIVVPNSTCSIVVGDGGSGGIGPSGSGVTGNNTIAFSLTALGGGAGTGCAGGSGAGGDSGVSGGTGTQPSSTSGGYGNNGGTGNGSAPYGGGGGGGAGGAGQSVPGTPAGNGGVGITFSLLNLTQVGQLSAGNYYVGGGGGGGNTNGNTAGSGGLGGGGAGGSTTSQVGGNGTANTGGGGGAGGNSGTGAGGGKGGSGVVILGLQLGAPTIGATYVTQDTCTIYYYNGSSWVSRGTYNSSYNQSNCSMYTGYGALSSSINTVGFTNLSANTGVGNIGIGAYAGQNVTTGSYNNIKGYLAGCALTTGSCNVILGTNAGKTLTSGNCNTFIGVGADTGVNSSNTILISAGTNSMCYANNTMYVGNLSTVGIVNEAAVTEVTLVSATPPLNNATFNFDVCSQSILYYTGSLSGNFTLNVRGNSTTPFSNILNTGQTTTLSLILTTGTPSYYLSAFNIDNTVYYPKYQSGVTPANTYTNAINIYTYSITRTSQTPSYLVLGSFACFQ